MNSIDILTQSALRKLKYDITIKAIIKTIVDVKTGEYKVLYEGNLLSAFAKDDKTAYDINDTVYVKVPEGDFDNKLIIDYKLRGADLSASEVDELRNSMFEVSDDLLKVTDEFGIASGITESRTLKIKDKDGTDKNIQIEDLSYYSNKYEYVKLKATFRTQFFKTFVKGNYGLEFVFNGEEKYSYKLDSTDFNGNPYYLVNNTEQDIIIQIPTAKLKGLEAINLYQNMENDYTKSLPPNTKDDSSFINYDSTKYNIFVKDIKLFFMEKVDLFNLPYYFRVKALQGNDCAKRELCFIPQLLSNGAEVNSNSEITWYEQDLTVDVASDNYDRAVGVGWKKIPKTVDNPNGEAAPCIYNNSLYVPKKSIPQIKRFKVIATYDKSTFDKTIEAINSSVTNSYSLVYENNSLKVQNVTNKNKITWYYAIGTSTFARIDNSTDTLSLANYTKYINVKFYCVVEDVENKTKTILEYDYTNEIVEEITVTYDGTSMFKYDANGKIDDTIYSSEYALTAKVAFQNGLSDKQYEIKWYDPDGNELAVTDQKREIKNSMITQVRLDTKNSIRYNISSYYKQDSNNTFKIKIITADKEYSFEKEITFIKDGDQGTNGSACALVIKPVDGKKDYLDMRKTGDSIKVQAFLYQADLSEENVTAPNADKSNNPVSWEYSAGLTGEGNINGFVISLNGSTNESNHYWVKATYSSSTAPSINAYYPIDIIKKNDEVEPNLKLNIAKYIKYDALGTNPICRREILGCTENDLKQKPNGVFTIPTGNYLDIIKSDNKFYLSPNSNYPWSGDDDGFISITYQDSIIHTIYIYKNLYGNSAINGWDGTKLVIDKNGKYILAPQIGAGTKNSDNQFTGVVMGYDSTQEKNGLYGYQNGTSTFGFKTDGTGYIGAEASGRISFDGKNAVIYGGLSQNGKNSMTLNLYNDATDDKNKTNENTLAIDIKGNDGSSTFSVNYGGKLESTSGTIGGWKINSDTLTGGNTILSSTGTITTNNLVAKTGCEIGPWKLNTDGLYYIPEDKDEVKYPAKIMKDKINIPYVLIIDEDYGHEYGCLNYFSANRPDLSGDISKTVTCRGLQIQSLLTDLHIDAMTEKLILDGSQLWCYIPAANQYGIYARFAD